MPQRVATILNDAEFTEPPSRAQRLPVSEWLDAARFRGDDVVVLEPGLFTKWQISRVGLRTNGLTC